MERTHTKKHEDGSETEICVLCGADTGVDANKHIDFREGYIEGAGQVCPYGCDGGQKNERNTRT